MTNPTLTVDAQVLRTFTATALEHVGISPEDAAIAAEVLVASDLRGIESHGVARLRFYIARIKKGLINTQGKLRTVRESPATVALDANNGLGMPAAYRAMQICIERAQQFGCGVVAVRGSNHFGIAGYYAMMALPHDMIGIAMTNASPIVVPFGGTQSILGTNPIAYAIPCGEEPAIVVDMATSASAFGKIEVALRKGISLPLGWALGIDGRPTTDAHEADRARKLLPVGGLSEGTGYKGYALSTVVEALCHALSGAAMSMNIVAIQARGDQPSNIGHFFAAYRIDGFRDVAEFKHDMDELVRALHACPPQPGVERVLVPGEKEDQASLKNSHDGVPLDPEVVESLRTIATELNIPSVV